MSKLHPIIKDGQDQRIDGESLYTITVLCLVILAVALFVWVIGKFAPHVPTGVTWIVIVTAFGGVAAGMWIEHRGGAR